MLPLPFPSFTPILLLPRPLGSGGETAASGGVHFTAQSAVITAQSAVLHVECTGQRSGYSVLVLHFIFEITWAYCRVFIFYIIVHIVLNTFSHIPVELARCD